MTWIVSRYLQRDGHLRRVLADVGARPAQSAEREPTLLLWGVPVPCGDENGEAVRERLIEISDRVGEKERGRSEPDLIADFAEHGVVVVEVKYRSANDKKPSHYTGWTKYFRNTEVFKDEHAVRATGLYELARNWRIGFELAHGRPFTLLNLGRDDLFQPEDNPDLSRFTQGLNESKLARFLTVTWRQFLSNTSQQSPLYGYARAHALF